jgi:hypothetical protein
MVVLSKSALGRCRKFLPEAGKRAIFVAKRPTYGRCATHASPTTCSDNRLPANNDKQ